MASEFARLLPAHWPITVGGMPSYSLPLLAAVLFSAGAALAPAAPAKPLLTEDFESTPVGEIPKGFTKTGAVGVVDDVAHSGKKSLRMDAAIKGGRKITKDGPEIAALGGEHWGRVYYKVKLPVPAPVIPEGKTSGIIHSTLISGKASSPLANDPIEFRMLGNILNSNGSFKYLFNVQPSKRPEFATGAKAPSQFSSDWVLVEWHVDHATQTYQLFVDGQEVTDMTIRKGAGQFAGLEVPAVFESLSFGWTNYQPAAAEGFTAWMDDIALGKERIGPTVAAAAKR